MNKSLTEAFEKTKVAGSIAAGALDEVSKMIKPGISTNEIDKICYEFINDNYTFNVQDKNLIYDFDNEIFPVLFFTDVNGNNMIRKIIFK